MQLTLALHEIISWLITAVSITLFLYERKKNNLTPFYMNLQGLLKTCHTKTVFYWSLATKYEEVCKPDEKMRCIAVSSDFQALTETIMGIMKAIEPDKDMPFDTGDYTRIKAPANNKENSIK